MAETFDTKVWDMMADSFGQPDDALMYLIAFYEYHIGVRDEVPKRLKDDLAVSTFQHLFRRFGQDLDDAQRERFCNTLVKQIKGDTAVIWCVDDSFTASESMLALAYQWTKTGGEDLRVKKVADYLSRLGRRVHNPAQVIGDLADPTKTNGKPWVTIVEKAAGQRSALFKLTSEGLAQGKQMWERVNGRPRLDNEQ